MYKEKQAASCLPASYYSFESDYMSLHFKYIQWFLSANLQQDSELQDSHVPTCLHNFFHGGTTILVGRLQKSLSVGEVIRLIPRLGPI